MLVSYEGYLSLVVICCNRTVKRRKIVEKELDQSTSLTQKNIINRDVLVCVIDARGQHWIVFNDRACLFNSIA